MFVEEGCPSPDTVIGILRQAGSGEPDYFAVLRARGFTIDAAAGDDDVGRLLRSQRVFAALVDLSDAPPSTPLDLVERVRDVAPDLRLVAMVPPGPVGDGILPQMVGDGTFYDFHTTPPDLDRLACILGHIRGLVEIERRARPWPRRPAEPYMVGASPAMIEVYGKIRKFAPFDAPVLITGETGTGKEVAARAIHERSAFRDGPFVPINCAALPATLIAAELFGHEKGTFTGAHERKIGRLESADKGTVFLDELGDMPIEVQAHLLRFLQDKTIDRLGSTKSIRIDVRVIVATNVDLAQAVREGRFREDLFYRLNVLTLQMPALRDRGDDIDLLAQYFLDEFCRDHHRRSIRLGRSARIAMGNYAWPGNVRELISTVRRGAVLASGSLITAADLGLEAVAGARPSAMPTLARAKEEVERRLVADALRKNGNVVQHAAKDLGISRVAFYRLMRKFELSNEIHH